MIDKKIFESELNNSAMLAMSLGSKELFHSNFLEWISKVDRNMFKNLLNSLLGEVITFTDKSVIKREYHNFDLCIGHKVSKKGEKGSKESGLGYEIDVIIENKVKSIPTKEQLIEHQNARCKKSRGCKYLLLTLVTEFDGKEEIESTTYWKIVSYAKLAEEIKQAKSTTLSQYHSDIIDDYVTFIHNLNKLASAYSIEEKQTFRLDQEDIDGLKDLRIYDLVEKLRACQIALELKKRIKQRTGRDALPCNRKHMFQNCKCGDIIINYGLTHAQGFFELKVVIEQTKVALVIQIQGGKYCYAVELSETKQTEHQNWEHYSNNPRYSWFFHLDDCDNVHDFNKYGEEFLYTYQNISYNDCVSDVIARVLSDYDKITEHFPETK